MVTSWAGAFKGRERWRHCDSRRCCCCCGPYTTYIRTREVLAEVDKWMWPVWCLPISAEVCSVGATVSKFSKKSCQVPLVRRVDCQAVLTCLLWTTRPRCFRVCVLRKVSLLLKGLGGRGSFEPTRTRTREQVQLVDLQNKQRAAAACFAFRSCFLLGGGLASPPSETVGCCV